MLEARALSKTFALPRQRRKRDDADRTQISDGRFCAVREVSFCAQKGAIVGLLGPNGAGKTTLLRLLSTALEPSSGTALFDGVDVVQRPLEIRRRIGFLSGNTGLYDRLTPREMVTYYGKLHGLSGAPLHERVDRLFETLGIKGYADRRNGALSSGMRQRVSIARTMVHDPACVIFDEPTTGLDVVGSQAILKLVAECRDEGKVVVFSTHNMHEVEALCDLVVVIDRGRVVFTGPVDELCAYAGGPTLADALLALVQRSNSDA